jgi:hypothetical protein
MRIYTELLIQFIIGIFDDFESFILNKPTITIAFPASGFGSLFIPDTIVQVNSSPILHFIDTLTPYLKFIFLIFTLVLTVVSLILQIRKLMGKDKKKNNE